MKLSDKPLYTKDQIRERIRELALAISDSYLGHKEEVVMLIVLKGALHFGSDLVRAMAANDSDMADHYPFTVDFVQARSYAGRSSTGHVDVLAKPTRDLHGKLVVIIEDILDTGVTANALLDFAAKSGARHAVLVALFDKPSKRKIPVEAEFIGFTVDDHFIVGYGMDYEERYRELPDVYTLA